MNSNPLNDAMIGRRLRARWVVCGTLTAETAFHLGGGEGDQVDMTVLRDPREGRPLLPGSTLAGALRNALSDWLAGFGKNEPPAAADLFGASRGDDAGSQSPLIVFDAIGRLPEGISIEIRDGVAISPALGVAEENKKYDYEVLPAGTVFPLRLDLLIAEASTTQEENHLLGDLAAACEALTAGQSSLGARRSRGLGRFRTVWAARRFDLASKQGWMGWICSDHTNPIAGSPSAPCLRSALESTHPGLKPLALAEDKRSRAVIDLDLKITDDILVRSPAPDAGGPDVSHLRSAGVPILPGTSLAGVMRSHALRIARLIDRQNGDDLVTRVFGPRFEGRRPTADSTLHASRLRIGEARIQDSGSRRQMRVAIDRFTGGAADTALFEEQPEAGGSIQLRLELRDSGDAELGLVLLVVRDLLDGTLPVGGTSAVGRGVLSGTATVTWQPGVESATLDPGKPAASRVDNAIKAFCNLKPRVLTYE